MTSLSEFCNPRKHLILEKGINRTRAEGLLEIFELHTIRNIFPRVTCVVIQDVQHKVAILLPWYIIGKGYRILC